jgi:hypothetical protein
MSNFIHSRLFALAGIVTCGASFAYALVHSL